MNVVNLLATIAPKSDQLNSDDLIGRTLTIKVAKVSLCSEPDQPIAIHYEGDNGKPYKPCKSMRRVLVQVWGGDGNAYVGRRMTLYRDPSVQFGGLAVGGTRISHMSDIDAPVTMALTATRANRKPFTVKPMPAEQGAPTDDGGALTILAVGREVAKQGKAALQAWTTGLDKATRASLKGVIVGELIPAAEAADAAKVNDGADPFGLPPIDDLPTITEPGTNGIDWPGYLAATQEGWRVASDRKALNEEWERVKSFLSDNEAPIEIRNALATAHAERERELAGTRK